MGWARANIIYDSLKEPPTPKTPLESLCLRIFSRRQRLKYIEALITLAVQSEKENRTKILDTYFNELFPYAKEQKWADSRKIHEVLEREMERGPMVVQKQEF